MNDNTAKVIDLEEYIRARAPLEMDDVTAVLDVVRKELPNADQVATDLVLKKHKLKQIEPWQEKVLRFELALKRASIYLEDKIAETENANHKEVQQELLKQCTTLMSRNKDLKAMIGEDVTRCRNNEKDNSVDLVRAAGVMLVTPFSIAKLVEFFVSNKPAVITAATEAGAALGLYLAFNRQWNEAGRKVASLAVKLPKGVKIVHRRARNAAFALTMSVSVAAKRSGDIQMREPDRLAARPKTMIAAKM